MATYGCATTRCFLLRSLPRWRQARPRTAGCCLTSKTVNIRLALPSRMGGAFRIANNGLKQPCPCRGAYRSDPHHPPAGGPPGGRSSSRRYDLRSTPLRPSPRLGRAHDPHRLPDTVAPRMMGSLRDDSTPAPLRTTDHFRRDPATGGGCGPGQARRVAESARVHQHPR